MAPSSSPSSATRASRRPSPSSSSTSASSSSNIGGSAPGLKTKLIPVYDPSPPKRDAVQRACDACRRNKQRCNGLSPCSRCAGKRECTYETQNKKNYTRLPTEMGAKQRKRLRWSRVWDEEGDVEMEEEQEVKAEEEPKPTPKVKETVWVKGGKKVAKETTTRAPSRGKKVEFEEEVDELESEGSESDEDEEELSKKDVVMEEKVECCEESSSKPSPSPHLSAILPSPPLLSVHPPTAFPPYHPFSTLSLPPTQPHLSPLTPSSSRLPPRQSISSPPLLPHKILRPHLITAQSVSSFRSTIVPSPIGSTPPPTPFSFTSLLPISATYLSVPEVIIKPPTPVEAGSRKRARTEWEVEDEEDERVDVEQVGGVFQDFRFLPPPIGGGKLVVGWSQ